MTRKAVGRGPRLVGAGANDPGPGRLRPDHALVKLVCSLDRAGPGDHHQRVAADGDTAHFDHRIVRMKLTADQFVGGKDRLDALDRRVTLDRKFGEDSFVAERTEHYALGPRHVQRLETGIADLLEQALGAVGGCVGLQYDDHGRGSLGSERDKKNPPWVRRAGWNDTLAPRGRQASGRRARRGVRPAPPTHCGRGIGGTFWEGGRIGRHSLSSTER